MQTLRFREQLADAGSVEVPKDGGPDGNAGGMVASFAERQRLVKKPFLMSWDEKYGGANRTCRALWDQL